MGMKEGRLQTRSQGDLSHRDWQKEGDHLLLSARHMRLSLLLESRKFLRAIKFEEFKRVPRSHQKLNAFPKASMLLIGYSIEMYLKSGLTKLLHGCGEELFRCQLREYSHNLCSLAEDLCLPLDKQDLLDLETLSGYVRNDARYPVSIGPDETYVDAFNKRSRSMDNPHDFRRFCNLAKRIRERVNLINNDRRNPASLHSWTVDGDGYLAFRLGGNLPTRVIVRYSSLQLAGEQPFENMEALAKTNSAVCRVYWDACKFYEDKKTKKGRKLVPLNVELQKNSILKSEAN